MADLDNDGFLDLITGCFEGGSYWLRGLGDDFESPKPMLDADGDVLRLGQYWDYDGKRWTHTETSEFPEELGISAFPVDWDADGDFDLLIGSNAGGIYWVTNSGTPEEPSFAPESTEVQLARGPARIMGHAMPVAADWDGDGLFDIVTGSDSGQVVWMRNVGAAGKPDFAQREVLIESDNSGLDRLGQRTQVAVADWDHDGQLDLIVGDYHSTGEPGTEERKHHGWVWVYRRLSPSAVDASAPVGD